MSTSFIHFGDLMKIGIKIRQWHLYILLTVRYKENIP